MKIKNCPWCKSKEHIITTWMAVDGVVYSATIQCKYCSCYCNGQSYKSRYKAKKQAIEGWNGIEDIEHERINQ